MTTKNRWYERRVTFDLGSKKMTNMKHFELSSIAYRQFPTFSLRCRVKGQNPFNRHQRPLRKYTSKLNVIQIHRNSTIISQNSYDIDILIFSIRIDKNDFGNIYRYPYRLRRRFRRTFSCLKDDCFILAIRCLISNP